MTEAKGVDNLIATRDIELDADAPTPLYVQLYWQLRELILQGRFPAGSRLPATRTLARALAVARVTVTQAYQQLAAEGYVHSRRGAGTFVRALRLSGERPAETPPPALTTWGTRLPAAPGGRRAPVGAGGPTIDFGFGRPFGQIFPFTIWRRLLARYLSSDDMILARYGSPAGFGPLREAVATYLQRGRGVRCAADDVVIVSGVQQALDILARLLLRPGASVFVETPGYRDAHTLFQIHGANLRSFAVDKAGFPTDQLSDADAPPLLFVTPANQFPQGGTLPLARRLALLDWARRRPTYIVEDDYDGELRYDGRPIAALQGLDEAGRVIYLGSFSKVLFPALRLGYVVLPSALRTPFVQAKAYTDRGAPTLTQAAVADFISEGHFERHLQQLRRVYGRRRRRLTAAIDQSLGSTVAYVPEPAGLHVMLKINRPLDEATLVKEAAAAGVGVYPGAPYHYQPPPYPSLLLGFSDLTEAEIKQGVAILARLIKR